MLTKATGWQVVAVPGLIPDREFYQLLSERKFPAGNFIRRADQLDYLEEPDVFHDVFGHVPLLMDPVFADYVQAYGAGGLRREREGRVHFMARLYWYTVEFGLLNTPEGLRICGAGIVSSKTESVFSLESPSPNRIGFDLARVMQTHYRIDDFQETYFVVDSFDQLFDLATTDFTPDPPGPRTPPPPWNRGPYCQQTMFSTAARAPIMRRRSARPPNRYAVPKLTESPVLSRRYR